MLTTKHDDPNKKLGWGERLAYGSGGFAFNMINGIIGSFLTIYFTSAAGLNAGIIATILAVSKIFDGVSDLIMGRIVDRTNTKMGKAILPISLEMRYKDTGNGAAVIIFSPRMLILKV